MQLRLKTDNTKMLCVRDNLIKNHFADSVTVATILYIYTYI